MTNAETTPIFTLRTYSNGQTSIHMDALTVHEALDHLGCYGTTFVFYRNNGFRVSPDLDKRAEARDILKALCPDSTVRITKYGVNVNYPAAMVEAHAELDADWQRMATSGMTHREMQNATINHPAFRAMVEGV